MKRVRGIRVEELSWHVFKKLLKKKYLYETYYDGNTKELYDLSMGSMTNDEYIIRFLELSSYVPYLKDEKEKIQRFICGFPVAFKYQIEYDEPRSLKETIGKLKHFYEKSKHKSESKQD